MRARSLAIGETTLALVAGVFMWAQSPAGSGSEPDAAAGAGGAKNAAPVIPLELQVEYFRTDGALAHLQAQLAEAQTEYEAAVKAITKACGPDAAPVLTQDKKHLFCVAQPKEMPPAPKK